MLLQHLIRGVLREAALSDGGDAGGASAADPGESQAGQKRAVHDRIKAYLFPPQKQAKAPESEGEEAPKDEGAEAAPTAKQPKKPAEAPKAKPQQAAAEDDAGDDAGEGEDSEFTTVSELAERTGLPLDRILDLSHTIKAGDKETRASLREMLRSYQTSELLNGKLQTHASEVAAWKTQQQQEQAAFQQNLQRMDAGLQVAQRMLQGEYNGINWEQLQQTDPAQFAQTLLGFQQRQAQLDQIAKQLGAERQTQQQAQLQQHQAYLAEQKQLLEAKLPEWSDDKARKAALTEIAEVVGKAYGFDAKHLDSLTDHRDFLVLNDALKWQKLQASKAEVLNKVRTAPTILKPGSAQSAQAKRGVAMNEAKAKLRKSGNMRDAARALIAGNHV